MKKYVFLMAVIGLSLSSPALTLEEALRLAAEQSPEFSAAYAEAQAASAEIRAASTGSNPELEFEAEGIGGNAGSDAAQYSLKLSQEVPTSGKIRKARAVAIYSADSARSAMLESRREVEFIVRQTFADTQAAREILTVREQQLALAEEFLSASQKRREAGAASDLEVLRAEMMLESGRIEKQAAEKTRATVGKKLARLTGLPSVETSPGDFFQPVKIPADLTLCETHPALQRLRALEHQAESGIALAKSAAIPDVTLGVGGRYEESGNVQSYLFSASVPLPLLNRGHAETLAAGFHAEAVRFENEAIRRKFQTELDEALAEFETASAEASLCRDILLPKAERAVELSRAGYASGRYGWLEHIEVQQVLAETRLRRIEAQHAALRAQAQLLKFNTGE